ncbi:MAG TPA: sigma 54-interacting transcriptional regulator [Myxococcota bacterium]|nr:sigma 54-interacting transcriptional regulator [Myxococcota bacterium]
MARRRKELLVSWLPTTHGAAPLLTILNHDQSPLRGRVDELVLCYQQPFTEPKHQAVLERTQATLEALPDEVRPRLTLEVWRSSSSPTDHGKLLEFSKDLLSRLRQREPDARINIQISSGTKAMHAVWLALAHGAFVEGEVQLLQTAEERHQKERSARPVEVVKLPQETWAHIVRGTRPSTGTEGADPELWDLTRVRSPSALETLETIERWAPMPAPILLIGERGTGKTTLAQVIRARSPFRALDKPGRGKNTAWPVVVCGQFRANPQLARSELFGHARGAFTGADAERKGILEQVNGDTLFLDEISDLDRGTQRLLIGAIEGRNYYRLGDEAKPLKADFRLIAATNRPLESLVLGMDAPEAASGIDADFFDRISTFILRIPPLRERREDLPQLWASVLRQAGRRAEVALDEVDAMARDKRVLAELDTHPLPGNMRDLQRAAWRAVAALRARTSRTGVVGEAMLGLDQPFVPTSTQATRLPIDLDAHLDAETRRLAELALTETGGNKAQAARLLGLPRKTFESKLKRLG